MSWSSRNNIVKQRHTAHQEIYVQWTQFFNFEPRICIQHLHVIPDFWTFCVLWLVYSHEAFGSMHFFFSIILLWHACDATHGNYFVNLLSSGLLMMSNMVAVLLQWTIWCSATRAMIGNQVGDQMKLASAFGGRSISSKTGTSQTLDAISYNVCFRCHQLQCMF